MKDNLIIDPPRLHFCQVYHKAIRMSTVNSPETVPLKKSNQPWPIFIYVLCECGFVDDSTKVQKHIKEENEKMQKGGEHEI